MGTKSLRLHVTRTTVFLHWPKDNWRTARRSKLFHCVPLVLVVCCCTHCDPNCYLAKTKPSGVARKERPCAESRINEHPLDQDKGSAAATIQIIKKIVSKTQTNCVCQYRESGGGAVGNLVQCKNRSHWSYGTRPGKLKWHAACALWWGLIASTACLAAMWQADEHYAAPDSNLIFIFASPWAGLETPICATGISKSNWNARNS